MHEYNPLASSDYDAAVRECEEFLGPDHEYAVGSLSGKWVLYARRAHCPEIYKIAAFSERAEAEAAREDIEARHLGVRCRTGGTVAIL
jgi:hypothetical protein